MSSQSNGKKCRQLCLPIALMRTVQSILSVDEACLVTTQDPHYSRYIEMLLPKRTTTTTEHRDVPSFPGSPHPLITSQQHANENNEQKDLYACGTNSPPSETDDTRTHARTLLKYTHLGTQHHRIRRGRVLCSDIWCLLVLTNNPHTYICTRYSYCAR